MKRAQALMRLGVTEDDLRTAERLFAELPVGDGVSCFFGKNYTTTQHCLISNSSQEYVYN
jgi:hypothetical protein